MYSLPYAFPDANTIDKVKLIYRYSKKNQVDYNKHFCYQKKAFSDSRQY